MHLRGVVYYGPVAVSKCFAFAVTHAAILSVSFFLVKNVVWTPFSLANVRFVSVHLLEMHWEVRVVAAVSE